MANDGLLPTQEEINRLAEIAAIRVNVLQRAIGALIVSHPDPAAFAREFSIGTANAQVDHHLTAEAGAWRRKEAAEYAAELLVFAHHVADSRRMQGEG